MKDSRTTSTNPLERAKGFKRRLAAVQKQRNLERERRQASSGRPKWNEVGDE